MNARARSGTVSRVRRMLLALGIVLAACGPAQRPADAYDGAESADRRCAARLSAYACIEVEARRLCAAAPEDEGPACRVRHAMERARARRDVIDFLCRSTKLAEIEAEWERAKGAKERTPRSPFDERWLQLARARVAEIEAESWQCIGEE